MFIERVFWAFAILVLCWRSLVFYLFLPSPCHSDLHKPHSCPSFNHSFIHWLTHSRSHSFTPWWFCRSLWLLALLTRILANLANIIMLSAMVLMPFAIRTVMIILAMMMMMLLLMMIMIIGRNREFSNERTRVERRETFRKLRMKENFSKAFEGYFQWIIRAGDTNM